MTVASKTTYLKGVFVCYKLLLARRFQEGPKHHIASPLRGYAASGRASTTVEDDVGSPGVVAFFCESLSFLRRGDCQFDFARWVDVPFSFFFLDVPQALCGSTVWVRYKYSSILSLILVHRLEQRPYFIALSQTSFVKNPTAASNTTSSSRSPLVLLLVVQAVGLDKKGTVDWTVL